jgi:hypothetical protein
MNISKKKEDMKIFRRKPDGSFYTPSEAFNYFISNLKSSEILFDSSVFSIVIVLELNDDIASPYLFYKYDWNKDDITVENVKKILLKITFNGPGKGKTINGRKPIKIPHVYYAKALTNERELLFEVKIQLHIYKRSYMSSKHFLDPVCPAIYNYSPNLDEDTKEILKNKILSKLKTRTGKRLKNEKEIVKDLFIRDISIITMMDLNCNTLSYFLNSKNLYESFKSYFLTSKNSDDDKKTASKMYAMYELFNLYELGYAHLDYHLSNVLYSPDEKHFDESQPTGRAYIIDFGHTRVNHIEGYKDMDIQTKIRQIILYENKLRTEKNYFWFKYTYAREQDINTLVDKIKMLSDIKEQFFKEFCDRKKINIEELTAPFIDSVESFFKTLNVPQLAQPPPQPQLDAQPQLETVHQISQSQPQHQLDEQPQQPPPQLETVHQIAQSPPQPQQPPPQFKTVPKIAQSPHQHQLDEQPPPQFKTVHQIAQSPPQPQLAPSQHNGQFYINEEPSMKNYKKDAENSQKRAPQIAQSQIRMHEYKLQKPQPVQTQTRDARLKKSSNRILPTIPQLKGGGYTTEDENIMDKNIQKKYTTEDENSQNKYTTEEKKIIKIDKEKLFSLFSNVHKYSMNPDELLLINNENIIGGMKKHKHIVNKLKKKCLNKTKKNKKCLNKTKKIKMT